MNKYLKKASLILCMASSFTYAQTNIVRGPYIQMATDNSMIVRWNTDIATNSQVNFGNAVDSLTQQIVSSELTTEHEVNLTGLSPLTRYYYSIGSSSERLSGNDNDTFFETSPLPGQATPTRIWILGDPGRAGTDPTTLDQKIVRDGYYDYAQGAYTDFWLMLGDNAYVDGTIEEYQNAVFNQYPKLLKQSPLWPVLGNHDNRTAKIATETGGYYDLFSLPTMGEAGGTPSGHEAYFSFDYGNIHVVVLNSSDDEHFEIDGPMDAWLETDLANTTAEWLITVFHHPVYAKSGHDSDTEYNMVKMREIYLPIFDKHGVDLVMTGHNHFYTRTTLTNGHYGLSDTYDAALHNLDAGDGKVDGDGAYTKKAGEANSGTIYITHGAGEGGGSGYANVVFQEDIDSGKRHPTDYIKGGRGSMVLDINDKTLTMNVIGPMGDVVDYFTIEHSGDENSDTANLVPNANINGPYSSNVTDAINFSSQGSTDTDGQIVSYSWNFGDDSTDTDTSELANPSYSYSQAGQYNATLTVTDNKGASNSSVTSVTIAGGSINSGLENGVVKNVAGLKGEEQSFIVNVPQNATLLSISTSGGTGDVDLYVRYELAASTSDYDCRPYKPGNNEVCDIEPITSGVYHVMLRGYSDYSDVHLVAHYSEANNQLPTAKVNGPYQGVVGSAISFSSTGSIDSDGSITSYDWQFGDGASSEVSYPSYTYSGAGSYTVSLTVTDNLGLTSTDTAMVTIDEVITDDGITDACSSGVEIHTERRLETDIAYCLQNTDNNQQLQMTYLVSNEDAGKTLHIKTQYGTGNGDLLHKYGTTASSSNADQISNNDNNTESITVSAIESGWHYIHVRANPEFSAVTLYLSFENNQAPDADANGPYSANIAEDITFNSDGSFDADGAIAQYLWQFGDGSTSNEANPSYNYTTVGTYTATLTLTDDLGAVSSDSAQVVISDVEEPPFIDACTAGEEPKSTGRLEAGIAYCLQETQTSDQLQFSHMIRSADVGKELEISVSYGSGNADLQYRFGSRPNSTTWDSRSANSSNEEVITVESVDAGWSYIHVRANPEFSGATIYLRYIEN